MISVTPGDKFIRVADDKEFSVTSVAYDENVESLVLTAEDEEFGTSLFDLVAMLQAGTLRRVESE